MLTKTTLIILTSLIIVNVYAQERTTKPRPIIGEKVITKLSDATGWMLNPDGEWISRLNRIPESLNSEYNLLLDYEKHRLGTDNFNYYQLRELTFNDLSYYILIKSFRDGYYSYPSIKEDWNKETSYYAYVFTKTEFEKIKNIEDGRINLIEINIIDEVKVFHKSESEAYSLIPVKIELNRQWGKKYRLIFHVAPYKQKNIVQFQIYTAYGKTSIGGIVYQYRPPGSSYAARKTIYLTDELFSHCYYETNYENFNDFLRIDK